MPVRLETQLDGLVLLEPEVHGDERGFLVETFSAGGVGRGRGRRRLRPGQPLALARRDPPRPALPDRARPGEAGPLPARPDLGRRRRPAPRLADLRALGGPRARRRRPSPAVRPGRLRARLLRPLRGRRRPLQALELLRPRDRGRDRLERPRGRGRVAARRPAGLRARRDRAEARRGRGLASVRVRIESLAAGIEGVMARIASVLARGPRRRGLVRRAGARRYALRLQRHPETFARPPPRPSAQERGSRGSRSAGRSPSRARRVPLVADRPGGGGPAQPGNPPAVRDQRRADLGGAGVRPEPFETCGVGAGYEDAYVEFAWRLLQRYPGSQVQAWNEPNISLFGEIPPERMAQLTRAVHRVAPGQVIGPAPAPSDPTTGSTSRRWSVGCRDRRRWPSTSTRGSARRRHLDERLRQAERIAGGRPIWVTEIGFADCQFGAHGQARSRCGPYASSTATARGP